MIQRRPRRCQHKTGDAAALCETRRNRSRIGIPHSAARPLRPRGVKVSQWRSRRRHRMRQLMVLCVVVAALPVSYFVQTMNDFRDGLRKSAEPRKTNTNLMITYAKTMTADEIREAAAYFGAMPWTPWIRVVETDTVPAMVSRGGIWIPV